jgi:alanyl-tRNA synthetase
MTDRLYYTDPYLRAFDASVTRVIELDKRPAVVLDSTAFYPTSGGQPFDTGWLGGSEIVDVVDVGGDIAHVMTTAPRFGPGTVIRGEIDWVRRFDHMQQHTGQHVLSAAFVGRFDNATMSFHMGSETSTIDLAREASPADIEQAVDEANRIVWENRDVSIRFVAADEAARLPLRKEPAREGPLRVIDIADFDLSACGGTHVSATGAIGLIASLGSERFRGGTRVTFVCGRRALRSLRIYRDAVSASVRVLSVLPGELPAAVEKAHNEARELRKTIKTLQEALASQEAARLLGSAPRVGDLRIVAEQLDGWDAAGLKTIASTMAASGRAAVLLVSAWTPLSIVVARSQDVPIDANAVVRALTGRFGGRGGGKPDLAQGGGLIAAPDEVLRAARALLEF